jgi:hypothetical protein
LFCHVANGDVGAGHPTRYDDDRQQCFLLPEEMCVHAVGPPQLDLLGPFPEIRLPQGQRIRRGVNAPAAWNRSTPTRARVAKRDEDRDSQQHGTNHAPDVELTIERLYRTA